MAKVAVYNTAGEQVSEMDLNSKIFGVEKIDANLVHEAVRTQRANSRASIAHTKTRGEVRGGGKKPWKQKGTGRARAGSIRSPLWKGGGVTFGPRNARNWSLKMNKSAFRKAIFTVLTDKLNEKKVAILDKIEAVEKTKDLVNQINTLAGKAGLEKKFVLIVAKPDNKLTRVAKNLPNVTVLAANQLNVIDLLHHDVIVTKDALEVMEKIYLK
ncbi:MAG TPA: 50S ribosomal protein L4 [Candidatus Binatia bacterium]|nr:50S ribosomal protein L4 [Candidatus Binatia bacterium]